jgi:hypothetical protein
VLRQFLVQSIHLVRVRPFVIREGKVVQVVIPTAVVLVVLPEFVRRRSLLTAVSISKIY